MLLPGLKARTKQKVPSKDSLNSKTSTTGNKKPVTASSSDDLQSQQTPSGTNDDDTDDAYATYEQGKEDNVDAYFVDDNPLAPKNTEQQTNKGINAFHGELGERLNLLMSDSFDDLSGARLKLKLMELYKRKKSVDINTLEPNDAIWYSNYVKQQQEKNGTGTGDSDTKTEPYIVENDHNEENLRILLQKTRQQLAEYQAKVAALEADKKEQELNDGKGNDAMKQRGISKGYTPGLISGISSYRLAASAEFDVSIHEATLNKDEDTLEDILVTFPKAIRSVDNEGRTALHLASKVGHTRVAKMLLDYGAVVNAQDAEGQCALHLAADVEMVRLLCAHGADTSIQDNHGFTPLHIHVMMMRPDVVDALMGHSADPRIKEPMRGRNALHLAADTGNFAIFSTVITESQVLVPIDEQDIDGNSALHILASNRHERRILHETDLPPSVSLQKCLMMLLDRGASTNLRNHRGSSPLHYVCANRSLRANCAIPPFVDILLEMRADPNVKDNENCTPLMICAVHGDWESCILLVSRGADMNVPCLMTARHLVDPAGGLVESVEDLKSLPKLRRTAMDLFPPNDRELRLKLFSAIATRQTKITRKRQRYCMECGYCFQLTEEEKDGGGDDDDDDDGPPKTTVVDSILTFFSGGGTPTPEMVKVSSILKSHVKVAVKEVKKLAINTGIGTRSSLDETTTTNDTNGHLDMGHCEHCGRLLCRTCLVGNLMTCFLPSFLQPKEVNGFHQKLDDSVPLCGTCQEVLVKPENIPA